MKITFVVLLCCIAAALAYPIGDLLDTMIMDEGYDANNDVHYPYSYNVMVNPGEEPREVEATQQQRRPEMRRPGMLRPGMPMPRPEMPRSEMPGPELPGPGVLRHKEPMPRPGMPGPEMPRPAVPTPRRRPIEETDSSRSESSRSGSRYLCH